MSQVQEWISSSLMCAPEALPPLSTPLREIEGWDSLRHLSLILGLERELNQQLSADAIQAIVTLDDVASLLRSKFADA